MAKRLNKLQSPNDKKCYSRDEEEIFNYNYEGTSDTHPASGISSFIKLPHLVDSSKENVELSLEVEIADSLKHLIASPARINADLLDVTIVRPTDLDFVRGLDTSNTLAFKSSEVRNLIASMEREKQHKKKLIDECKRKAAASKINTINEIHETDHSTDSKHTSHKERELYTRRLKRPENTRSPRNNITVMSAPPECSRHVELDKKSPTANTDILKYKVGKAYANSTPIAVLKPLVGEIKESLKHLEESISQIGDGSSNNSDFNHYKKHFVPTLECNMLHCNHDGTHYSMEELEGECTHTQQIYAAANNYDKLKNLLACQKLERRDEDNEKPCLCQHCGMVGLLIESQKRPIISPTPAAKIESTWPKNYNNTKTKTADADGRAARKDSSRNSHTVRINDDNWIIRDLTSRLEALEIRVAAQEQRAVPRDYFKRIINKLWHRQNSDSLHNLPITNQDRTQHLKNNSIQCSLENLEKMSKIKRDSANVKHRNVQIQQNTRRNFYANPVVVAQLDLTHPTQSTDSHKLGCNENVETKTTNTSDNVFTKKTDSAKNCDEVNTPKGKPTAMESFWRWGEEIIKPGFDLKIKIMSLLDEQFRNTKTSKDSNTKGGFIKKSEIKVNTSNSSSAKSQSTSKTNLPDLSKANVANSSSLRILDITPDNLFEAPLPFEDREILNNRKQTVNEENVTTSNSSSRTLKKMLDMMSAKIYNDHVKPTVEAIKEEQKSFNHENTKQIYNIKAAMDAALCKINIKEFRTSNTYSATGERQQREKDFLEPLEIPTSIKNDDDDLNDHSTTARLSKKSAIPVRIANTPATDSVSARNTKYVENRRSLIPCLKPIVKDKDKTHKKEKYESQCRKSSIRKHDIQCAPDSLKSKKDKNVHIKYINPKIDRWNEESGASIQTESSEENRQATLTDKSNKCENVRDNNAEEKRRFSPNHSIKDKLAFLTKLAKTEIGKADIWNNILKQAKKHCRSKQDTVVIQIPTKTFNKQNCVGVTEVEFTIEDLQKLVNSSKLADSVNIPQETIESDNMESFLLIRSRKILEEVQKRLGNACRRK